MVVGRFWPPAPSTVELDELRAKWRAAGPVYVQEELIEEARFDVELLAAEVQRLSWRPHWADRLARWVSLVVGVYGLLLCVGLAVVPWWWAWLALVLSAGAMWWSVWSLVVLSREGRQARRRNEEFQARVRREVGLDAGGGDGGGDGT